MAACSGCSGCCGTWPCSWTGRTRPAGLRTASRTCWAASPMSSAAEPPAPSSDRYGTHGGRRGRGGRRWCILKLARSQSPTAGDIERNADSPTVKMLPSYIMSSVSGTGQLPVYNNDTLLGFFGLIFYSYLALCLSNDQSISNNFPSCSTDHGKGKKPHPSFPVSCA